MLSTCLLLAIFVALVVLVGSVAELARALQPGAAGTAPAVAGSAAAPAAAAAGDEFNAAVAGMREQPGFLTLFTSNSSAPAKVLSAGAYPIVTLQHSSTTLSQISYQVR
jgi:hypothetical protein